MILRKLLTFVLILSMFMMISTSTLAKESKQEDDFEVIYQAEEITDVEKLIERAKKGINESEVKLTKVHKGNENFDYMLYETSQKIKEKKSKKDGTVITTYSNFVILEAYDKDKSKSKSTVTISAVGNDPNELTSSSLSYRIYINYNYDRMEENDQYWVKALHYYSLWEQMDSQVINTKMVKYGGAKGQSWENPNDLIISQVGVSTSFSISSPSSDVMYNHVPPSTWGHTNVDADDTYNGFNTVFTFTRGTTTWQEELAAGFGDAAILYKIGR